MIEKLLTATDGLAGHFVVVESDGVRKRPLPPVSKREQEG